MYILLNSSLNLGYIWFFLFFSYTLLFHTQETDYRLKSFYFANLSIPLVPEVRYKHNITRILFKELFGFDIYRYMPKHLLAQLGAMYETTHNFFFCSSVKFGRVNSAPSSKSQFVTDNINKPMKRIQSQK